MAANPPLAGPTIVADRRRPIGRGLSASRLVQLRALMSWSLFQPVAAVFVRGLEVLAKFGFQIAVARCLPPRQAGVFLLGLSIMSVLQTLATAGIGRALVMFVSRVRRDTGREAVFATAVRGLFAMLLFAGLFAVATAVLAKPLSTVVFHKPELTGPLQWMALAAACFALLTGVGGVLTALGAAAIGDFLRSSFWPALAAGLLIISDHTATSAAMLTAFTVMVALCLAWLVLRRLAPGAWPRAQALKPPPGLLETAIPLCVVDTIGVILVSVPTLVLGSTVAAEGVAVFSVANRIANVFITVVGAIGNAASPRFALAADEGDRAKLGRAVSQVALLSLAVCLPPALVLIAFPAQAMSLFGQHYRSGADVLRVLIAGDLVFVLFACCGELLAMSGSGRLLRRLNFVLLGACFGLSFLLIPRFGPMGAACAMALTLSLNGVLVGWGVWRRLGLNPLPLLAGLQAR